LIGEAEGEAGKPKTAETCLLQRGLEYSTERAWCLSTRPGSFKKEREIRMKKTKHFTHVYNFAQGSFFTESHHNI
jgi:hypothetical protein